MAEENNKRSMLDRDQLCEMLTRCTEAQNLDEWNTWRENHPDKDIDLKGVDLQGRFLKRINLKKAKLEGARLAGAKLQKANLRDADLRDADLSDADLIRADLSYANLSEPLRNMREANLSNANLSNANLRGANLSKVNLSEADLSDADLIRADLSYANLKKANLVGANLSYADLVGADINKANLVGADLSHANLSYANLRESYLREANLNKADLSHADLVGANLSYADLSHAIAGKAKFSNADLREVDLRNADLTGAKLNKADLSNADLTYSNLSNAILDNTKLKHALIGGTTFGNVNLGLAKDLETVSHEGPSTIGMDTIKLSEENIPEIFLRNCGLLPWEIEIIRLYNPALTPSDVDEILATKIYQKRVDGPLYIGGAFISYSHADSAFVNKLYKELQDAGVSVWLDRHDILAGSIEKQVMRQIRLKDIVVLVLSEHSIKSDWVETEIEEARDKEKDQNRDVLCPIAIDDSWQERNGILWRTLKREKIILDFSAWKTKKFRGQFDKLIKGMQINYSGQES